MYKKLLTATAVSIALSGCIADESSGPGSASNVAATAQISGETYVQTTVQVAGVSDPDGITNAEANNAYLYQWFYSEDAANYVAIEGETSDSYDVKTEDAGRTLLVQVYFTDDKGSEETAGAKITINGDDPGYINLLGDAQVGEELKASVIDGDGTTTSTIDYTWGGMGTAVGDTYTVVEGDLGSMVTVTATYSDDRGFYTVAEGMSDEVVAGVSGPTTTQTAYITDTNLNGSADGELRIKFNEALTSVTEIAAGRVEATLLLQTDEDSTSDPSNLDNKMYISIYSSCCSNSGLHGDIVLAEGGVVQYRDPTSGLTTITDLTWTDGESIDFVASWTLNDYQFSLDGGATFSGPYTAINTTAVQAISFKVGTSSKVSTYELYLDDLAIYDGANEEFSDDFEGYSVNESLDDNGTYNKDSNEVVVAELTSEPAPVTTQTAYITDTNVNGSADGELRIKFNEALTSVTEIAAGRVEATLLLQTDEDSASDPSNLDNKMYISIYSSCCSNSGLHGDIVLAEGGVVQYRDPTSGLTTITDLTWTDGESIDFVASWTLNDYQFSLDGGATFSGPYAAINTTAVQAISFKVGTSSKVSTYELYLDDLAIYDGANEEFSDDFEGYSVTDSLDDNGTYNKDSNEVVVAELTSEPAPVTTQTAYITDTNVNGSADGELRIKFNEALTSVTEIAAGRVEATLLLQTDEDSASDPSNLDNKMYISIYSSCCSNSGLHGDIVLAEGGVVQYRDPTSGLTTITDLTWTDGESIDFVASWTLNDYQFSLDGGATFSGPYAAINTTAVQAISFKVGTSSKVSTYELYLDDLAIYDGASEEFSDDFEGYSVTDSLDDNGTYNKDSNEVVVAEIAGL